MSKLTIVAHIHANSDKADFVENWESRELWQKHMNALHRKTYMENTEGAIAEFTLNEMTYID